MYGRGSSAHFDCGAILPRTRGEEAELVTPAVTVCSFCSLGCRFPQNYRLWQCIGLSSSVLLVFPHILQLASRIAYVGCILALLPTGAAEISLRDAFMGKVK